MARFSKYRTDAFAVRLVDPISPVLALSSVYHATMTILKLIREQLHVFNFFAHNIKIPTSIHLHATLCMLSV